MEILVPLIMFAGCVVLICIPFWVSSFLVSRRQKVEYDSLKKFNEKVLDEIKNNGFVLTKTFYLKAQKTGNALIEQYMVCVDSENKKLCFIDYASKTYRVVDFKDFITYKVFENNGVKIENETKTAFDSTLTTTVSKNVCKRLKLIIVINDMEQTNIVYDLIKSGMSFESSTYKALINSIIELTSFLDVVDKNTPKSKKYIYCKYCGVKNSENSAHCSACGSVLKD